MYKSEYVDETNKVCVVVLKDHWKDTVAKGIARCSEDDAFDKEAGLKLANARAWAKYFDNAIKDCNHTITRTKKYLEHWEKDLDLSLNNLAILTGKRADLEKEIEELLSNL